MGRSRAVLAGRDLREVATHIQAAAPSSVLAPSASMVGSVKKHAGNGFALTAHPG
jgi:hypothetical protein